MYIHAEWLFLVPAVFVLGLFVGERWEKWSREDEPMDVIDARLDEVYHMIDQNRKRPWNRGGEK